jgi:hypothetical protein
MAVHAYTFRSLCKLIKEYPYVLQGKMLTLSKYQFPSYKDCTEIANKTQVPFLIDEKYMCDKYSVDKIILNALGFADIEAVDISHYGGAEIIHDLNLPVPVEMKNAYDFILDAGTIEHIFDLPQVLKNIFDMLKVGGVFFFDMPYWYEPYHGFYNFSPLLMKSWLTVNNWDIRKLQPYRVSSVGVEMSMDNADVFPDRWGLCNGIAVKTDKSSCDAIPQDGAYDKSWDFARTLINRLKQSMRTHGSNGRIHIFGCGTAVRNLVLTIRLLYDVDIVSDNPSEIGMPIIFGIRVKPLDVCKPGDTVIIGSAIHQDIIYERIKYLEQKDVNVLKVFGGI